MEIQNFSDRPQRLVGAKTRRSYGYLKNGQKLRVFKVDVEAKPDWFLVQEEKKK